MALTVGFAPNTCQKWLDTLSSAVTFGTATPFVKIHTGIPGLAGTTTVSVGDATAKSVTFSAASAAGVKAMTSTPVWTNAATSETISHISLWAEAGATTFLLSGALGASQAWVATNTFTLTALSISLSPVAAT